jgi:hypothetical protein
MKRSALIIVWGMLALLDGGCRSMPMQPGTTISAEIRLARIWSVSEFRSLPDLRSADAKDLKLPERDLANLKARALPGDEVWEIVDLAVGRPVDYYLVRKRSVVWGFRDEEGVAFHL